MLRFISPFTTSRLPSVCVYCCMFCTNIICIYMTLLISSLIFLSGCRPIISYDDTSVLYILQGKIELDIQTLLSRKTTSLNHNQSNTSSRKTRNSGVPCWAFATFDGHAGPACAHYLKENFLVSERDRDGGELLLAVDICIHTIVLCFRPPVICSAVTWEAFALVLYSRGCSAVSCRRLVCMRRLLYFVYTLYRKYSGYTHVLLRQGLLRRRWLLELLSCASHNISGLGDLLLLPSSPTSIPPSLPCQVHLRQIARAKCKAAELRASRPQGNPDSPDGQVKEGNANSPSGKPSPTVEVLLARLLTDTLASLTREFERGALASGEVRERRGALVEGFVKPLFCLTGRKKSLAQHLSRPVYCCTPKGIYHTWVLLF